MDNYCGIFGRLRFIDSLLYHHRIVGGAVVGAHVFPVESSLPTLDFEEFNECGEHLVVFRRILPRPRRDSRAGDGGVYSLKKNKRQKRKLCCRRRRRRWETDVLLSYSVRMHRDASQSALKV